MPTAPATAVVSTALNSAPNNQPPILVFGRTETGSGVKELAWSAFAERAWRRSFGETAFARAREKRAVFGPADAV